MTPGDSVPGGGSEARARAEELFAKGLDAHDREELATAESYYRRAVEADPSFAIAHNNLGMVCIDMSRHEDAVREFQLALDLDPTHAEAHNNLGYLYRRLGDNEQAALHYAHFLALSPQVEDGPKMRQWIETATGRSPEEILAASIAAATAEPAPAEIGQPEVGPPAAAGPAAFDAPPPSGGAGAPDFDLSGLAGAEDLEGAGAGAPEAPPFLPGETPAPGAGAATPPPDAGAVEAAPDAGGESPDLGWLGETGAEAPEPTMTMPPPATSIEEAVSLFRDGETESALTACTSLLTADPGDATANLLAGRCQMRLGNYPQAVVFCLRATQAAPLDSEAFYFLGQAYEKRGLLDEARETYTRCVEAAPEGPRAKKLQEWLDRIQARSLTGTIKPGAGARCDYCLQVFPPAELQSHQGKRACSGCLATLQPERAALSADEPEEAEGQRKKKKSKRVPQSLPGGSGRRGHKAFLSVLLVIVLLIGAVYVLYQQGLLPETFEEGVRNFLQDVGIEKPKRKPKPKPSPFPPGPGPTPGPVGPTPGPTGPTPATTGLATIAFVSRPLERAQLLAPYGYLPRVEGRDKTARPVPAGRVEFKLLEGPAGMTVEARTGYIAWTPGTGERADEGVPPARVDVAISARAGRAQVTQRWTVRLAFPVERLSTLEGAADLHERCVLAASDLNGDGRADLVLGGGEVRAGRVRIRYTTDEKGSFSSPEVVELAGRCGALACADLTGDGKADLAVFDWARGKLHVYAQKKGGGIEIKPVQTLEAPRGVEICVLGRGDPPGLTGFSPMEGVCHAYEAGERPEPGPLKAKKARPLPLGVSARSELASVGLGEFAVPVKGGTRLYHWNGDAGWLIPRLDSPVAMAAGRFTAAPLPEYVLLDKDGSLHLFPVDRTKAVPRARLVAEGLPAPAGLAAADLNGDKRDDLVVAGGDRLIVLLSRGDGKFLLAAAAPFKGATGRFVLADFTGDGRVEAAALDAAGALVVFKLGEKPIPPPPPPPPPPSEPPKPEKGPAPAPEAPASPASPAAPVRPDAPRTEGGRP